MVFLALKPAAAREAIDLARKFQCSVWVASNALNPEEFQHLVRDGIKVTRFADSLNHASSEALAYAVATVEEHHPNETIWIQHSPEP